jgi:hypothetical protein
MEVELEATIGLDEDMLGKISLRGSIFAGALGPGKRESAFL